MDDYPPLHLALRLTHIVAGVAGIVLFWLAALTRKGMRRHVRFGRLFVLAADAAVITSLVSCAWALTDPVGFAHLENPTPDRTARTAADVRYFFAILGYLALNVALTLRLGRWAVATKAEAQPSPPLRILLLDGTVTAASTGLLLFGVMLCLPRPTPGGGLLIGLGLFGLAGAAGVHRFVYRPRAKGDWLIRHVDSMIGAGIAFHTAFSVFGLNRLLPESTFSGPWAAVPWVLPIATGIIAAEILKRRLRRRFRASTRAVAAAG